MRINTTDQQLRHALNLLGSNKSFAETVEHLESGGTPHDMVRAMAAYPPILEAMETLGNGIYPGGNLPRALKELIILQSSIAMRRPPLREFYPCIVVVLVLYTSPDANPEDTGKPQLGTIPTHKPDQQSLILQQFLESCLPEVSPQYFPRYNRQCMWVYSIHLQLS